MTAAILYHEPNFTLDGPKLMGRQSAGHSFVTNLSRGSASTHFHAMVNTSQDAEKFSSIIHAHKPEAKVTTFGHRDMARVAEAGCLHIADPLLARWSFMREVHGRGRWSLTGLTHTLASAGVMSGLIDLLSAPIMPWDAVICTSQACRQMILQLYDGQDAFMEECFGSTGVRRPTMPIIPLGVETAAFDISPDERAQARQALGVPDNAVVALFLGRLSFHAKAHPAPFFMAAQKASASRPIVVVECGIHASEWIGSAFAEAAKLLAPDVRHIVLDGGKQADRRTAWSLADIFCSFSDNVQETFGLTPLEAMAAGLPVIVSDWNGYRETVRDGIDGFMVPTIAPAPGTGADLGYQHGTETLTYDEYIAHTSMATAVDIEAAGAAFTLLANDPALRAKMGAAGRARARDMFDWGIIVPQYDALWDELARIRNAAVAQKPDLLKPRIWPQRPDPFTLFAHYPTRHLTLDTKISIGSAIGQSAAVSALKMNNFSRGPWPGAKVMQDIVQVVRERDGGRGHVLLADFAQNGQISAFVPRMILNLVKYGILRVD